MDSLLIVLAEDDDGHATLVQRNLARSGIINRVVHVRDGGQALDFVRREGTYADRKLEGSLLLLLDIKMPRVDGIEVLQRLKADARTASIPVIMLTTTDDPREVRHCYEIGCSVYVTKPVRYDDFAEALHRLGLFLSVVKVPREDQRPGIRLGTRE